jgi:hypothetical protein
MLYLTILNGDFDVSLSMVYSMVHSTTFNNILVISWLSVLFMEDTGGVGENHRPLSHNIVYHSLLEIRTHNISSDRH